MATCEVTVMFDDREIALIQAHTDAVGMSFSEFVRRAALEKAEDMADVEAYDDAMANDEGAHGTGAALQPSRQACHLAKS